LALREEIRKKPSPKIGFSPISRVRGKISRPNFAHFKYTLGVPMGEIKGKFNYRIFSIDPQIFTEIFDRPYLRKGGRYSHALFAVC